MEELTLYDMPVRSIGSIKVGGDKQFIEANTISSTLDEVKSNHIIPVFVKDNETVISHSDFIEAAVDVIGEFYAGETILKPNIRLSHPIKGRTPSAKDKPAELLIPQEKTLYYERMAFIIEVPTISQEIDGNLLSLTIGGVKAYNLDNLYTKKGVDESFKIFVGFQNKVCTNLCIWSDGYIGDLKVKSLGQLRGCMKTLIENYNASFHLEAMRTLVDYSITETEFAHIIGRCRLYTHLPQHEKNQITPLLLSDTQINTVVKDFYKDNSFCKDSDDRINLWKLYNLFTGSNKSSYIDTFLDRSVNAFHIVEELKFTLNEKRSSWYLN